MLEKIFGSNNAWGPFVLRLALGAFSIIHGTQKLFGAFDGAGLQNFSKTCAGMGLKPPNIWAIAIAIIQFVGGIFLVLGIMTRLSALLIGIIIVVLVTGGVILIDIEYQIILIATCVSLLFTGGGRAAIRD
jgi:putative oxidoreductase